MDTYFISCGFRKSSIPTKAEFMYTGPYFKALLNYAKSYSDNIYILSAKYGFLRLDQIIDPYNIKFGDPGTAEISTLKSQAKKLSINGKLFMLGGELYKQAISQVFDNVEFPIPEGLGMGMQISWLKNNSIKKIQQNNLF